MLELRKTATMMRRETHLRHHRNGLYEERIALNGYRIYRGESVACMARFRATVRGESLLSRTWNQPVQPRYRHTFDVR